MGVGAGHGTSSGCWRAQMQSVLHAAAPTSACILYGQGPCAVRHPARREALGARNATCDPPPPPAARSGSGVLALVVRGLDVSAHPRAPRSARCALRAARRAAPLTTRRAPAVSPAPSLGRVTTQAGRVLQRDMCAREGPYPPLSLRGYILLCRIRNPGDALSAPPPPCPHRWLCSYIRADSPRSARECRSLGMCPLHSGFKRRRPTFPQSAMSSAPAPAPAPPAPGAQLNVANGAAGAVSS